jgi:tetratricopeptide (TPR) repeat protein
VLKPVPIPDRHSLDAATGWLMLDNTREARLEFQQISPRYQNHPEVLDIEWRLLSQERRWEESLRVAELELAITPESAGAWIHRSYSLHELKRTAEALGQLSPAAEKFPDEPTIPYNLACYACQLGDLPNARLFLQQSLEIEPDTRSKMGRLQIALEDTDLRPLWKEIQDRLSGSC